MRRLVPLALLVVILMVTAAAAALGVAQRGTPQTPATAAEWVSTVLRTTEQTGSAHFMYSEDTNSPNSLLRQTISGSGAVDFRHDDARATETDRSFSFTDVTLSPATGRPVGATPSTTKTKEIVVGRSTYQQLGFPDDDGGRYVKLALPAAIMKSRGHFGLALNASVALAELIGPFPIRSVEPVTAPAVVHNGPRGEPVTAFAVTYEPLVHCTEGLTHRVTQPPSLVWVDGKGRLVQVRSLYLFAGFPENAKLPAAFANFPRGPTTTVATLTFSHFGSPVRISAPRPSEVLFPSRGSRSTAMKLESRPCPSK